MEVDTIKKRLLFIGVGFHMYDQLIIKELTRVYEVSYINVSSYKREHPELLSFYQHLGMSKKAYRQFECRIQQDIESISEINFDVIFIIKGEYLSEKNLITLRQYNPNANYVLYLWDSWINVDNRDILLKYFKGSIYTFDSVDSRDLGFILRPLFFIPVNDNFEKNIDLSFIGVNHSSRYEWLSRMKQIANANKLSYYFYLNVGYFTYLKHLYITHRYRKDDIDILKKESLPFQDYQQITLSSRVVIDYPDDNQTGLTMRTIESLGMGSRLITTNKYIKQYSDIPEDLYLVIDRENIDVTKIIEFINNKYSGKLPSRYTITGFLRELGIL